jgi:hypothetical protein
MLNDATLQGALRCVNEMQALLQTPPKLTELLTQIRGLGYGFFEGFGPSQLVFAPPRDSNTHACMGRAKGASDLLYKLKKKRAVVWIRAGRTAHHGQTRVNCWLCPAEAEAATQKQAPKPST